MRYRESVGLWGALAILAAIAVVAYRSVGAAAETMGWVEHTHHVIQQLEEVSSALARATTARRAYVVAGDASQLADVATLDARVAQTAGALRGLVADNPDQVRRVDALVALVDRRVATLDAAALRRRVEGVAAENAEGLAQGAAIRVVREEIEREENRLLAEREARTTRDLARTKTAEIVGTGASFVLLLFVFLRLRNEAGRRERSEEALRRANGFLDSIVENIPDMIFVKEADDLRFERINRAGEELLGVGRAELVGRNDFDFFPREQAESFQAADREVFAGRVVIDIPAEPIKARDGERWLHTKKVPILDERGVPRYLLGISEDITERRRADAALKDAKDAADAANRELEAFSYSVAHDLRAPLRGMSGFAQVLLDDYEDRLDAEGVDGLHEIRDNARRMGELIDALLSLSRVTRGELARERVDLAALARAAATALAGAEPGRRVDVVIDGPLHADVDPRLARTLLDNLVANAWKFTGKVAAPRVEVGVEGEGDGRAFFVRDNGAGFDVAFAAKLFAPFQRLHTVGEFPGTGIGLATVQRIVHRHGGRVWAEGAVGAGATFRFTLPAGATAPEGGIENRR